MDWNTYFINIAKEVAKKSKDTSSKVGAVIVDSNNRPISFGYNGFIAGCDESYMSQERPLKYQLVIHAEMNAILFAKQDLKDCKIYITHSPCCNCLKHIIQTGIKTIVYDNPDIVLNRSTEEEKDAIKRLVNSTNIKITNINNNLDYITELETKCEVK